MKKTILVVEDDKFILFADVTYLTTLGFEVWEAQNGLEALELLKNKGLPDLILLDMIMPVMDGWHFAQEFFKVYGHKVPIIVTTGAVDAGQRAVAIGAAAWIAKPFEFSKLVQLVNKHLGLGN